MQADPGTCPHYLAHGCLKLTPTRDAFTQEVNLNAIDYRVPTRGPFSESALNHP